MRDMPARTAGRFVAPWSGLYRHASPGRFFMDPGRRPCYTGSMNSSPRVRRAGRRLAALAAAGLLLCLVTAAPDAPGKDFLEELNPNSLEVLTGCKVERSLAEAPMPERGKSATAYQFMRQGYFCLDNQDAAPGHLVFNRSVSLKDSFRGKSGSKT